MDKTKPQFKIGTITHLTSYSTLVYLGALVIGELIDLAFISVQILPINFAAVFGAILIIAGSSLIIWTHKIGQKYSKLREEHKLVVSDLCHGPYRFSRNPHHLGIGLLLIGASIFINSIALISTVIIAFIAVDLFFIKREEKILRDRHGDCYDEYKTKTRRWL